MAAPGRMRFARVRRGRRSGSGSMGTMPSSRRACSVALHSRGGSPAVEKRKDWIAVDEERIGRQSRVQNSNDNPRFPEARAILARVRSSPSLFRPVQDDETDPSAESARFGRSWVARSALTGATGGGQSMGGLERILIVGGGIAGLTTAAALRQRGFSPDSSNASRLGTRLGPESRSSQTRCGCCGRLALKARLSARARRCAVLPI